MAKSITVELKGLRQLGESMRELKADVAKNISVKSTAAAAQVVKKAIRARAPVDTGNLRNNIIVKKLPKSETDLDSEHIVTVRKGRTKAQIRKNAREAYYAMFLEFGTVKMAARPFIRPGFEESKADATVRMVEILKKRIDEANRKVR